MKVIVILTVAVALVFAVLGIVGVIRNYAIDSIGELRYMLRCAKERYEICSTDGEAGILKQQEAENIKNLEAKIQNHWGRRLVRDSDRSIFDSLNPKF